MLNRRLVAKVKPKANFKNVVYWKDYRVTVLSGRLFRVEKSPLKMFRDDATQSVWFRNAKKQKFTVTVSDNKTIIKTDFCSLILREKRKDVTVEIDGKEVYLDNKGNLLGTYRTLDGFNGNKYSIWWNPDIKEYEIKLGKGVCSKTGVAVFDDSKTLSLTEDGQVQLKRARGTDEYVFAFGDDYRGAVNALYGICGNPPLVPRFALGNWWSRYHAYSDEEYLSVLNQFEDRKVPISVATVDMDWHYSNNIIDEVGISAERKNDAEYVGDSNWGIGWTGYTWNKKLFPNHKEFLNELHRRGMKITLNVHPADGIRWWEDCYKDVADALGVDEKSEKNIPFDFSYAKFINAYFDKVHLPLEREGVDFWWIDWQQPDIGWYGENNKEKYDPLWALNHYHYLDNGKDNDKPLILSRYAGVGSHRYPLGFSGDTHITWETLDFLPYFTANASNIGYTWWSHDIGGHMQGEKSDELFLRHVQFGVFSPINRLHCSCEDTLTKEPWAYKKGTGLIVEEFLRFRHKLIPYLYTASYLNSKYGLGLIEPLYYQWKNCKAYKYKNEYRFGSEMLVAPITQKGDTDGYSVVKVWLPKGTWTDIFTGDEYYAGKEGKELSVYRTVDSIPVFAKSGAIIPLSHDNENFPNNPKTLEVWIFEGNNSYNLYEDGKEENKRGSVLTAFKSVFKKEKRENRQIVEISSNGNRGVIPKNRKIKLMFKNVYKGKVKVLENGIELKTETRLTKCVETTFNFNSENVYEITVLYQPTKKIDRLKERARRVLTEAEFKNWDKEAAWKKISQSSTEKEFRSFVDNLNIDERIKRRIKETL